ncbi:MAG TPA: polysaccharide deacetylase family protein [Thiomonas arsenitoxydans]|uniref:polysaccharide deacetylase family protein n=1 Tax=Thiomonas TaxID=32012 RepID=UPI00257F1A7C|nr:MULTISPECIES: polysaccharide deacetylase family protein [Thiomonas]HML80480.1 polysaccharide deacetylase family protein [Thiomonas arsenitoxydans]
MADSPPAAPSALKSYARTSALAVALGSGVSHWLAHRHPVRRILMLHGVGGSTMPPGDFHRMLAWLKQRYAIVPLDLMVREILDGVPAPAGAGRSQLAITFDDGLCNQYRIARPILEQLEIPATIFVCPGLVDARQWMWNHEARARLKRLSNEGLMECAQTLNSPAHHLEGFIAWMKTLSLPQRQHAQDVLRDCTPRFVSTPAEHEAYDMMSWDEVRACDRGCLTIGSHTMTHPILPTLTEDEIQHELQDSRERLETELGRRVDLFCYPNGSTDERVRKVARSIYRAAVTTEEGMVSAAVDPIAIPRIPVTSHLPLLAWRMHRPWA